MPIEMQSLDVAICHGGHMYPKAPLHAQRRVVHSTYGWVVSYILSDSNNIETYF